MKYALAPNHFIFTPENPKFPGKVQNPSIEDVTRFLNSQGEDAQIVNGFYDGPERSILVSSPKNVPGLMQMAKDFGQESALHSQHGQHQLHYLNGPQEGQIVHGEGTNFHKEKPANNFTEVHTPDGPMYFQHNLNFPEPFDKSEGLDKSKNVRIQRKAVWGTNPNPPKTSKMGQKHINHIKEFAKKFLNLELHPSGGKIDVETGERRSDDPKIGTDKPDWRSGQLEAQWNPDAIIHELAHLMLLPKGVGLVAGQQLLDKQYGEVQSKHGYMQQKRSQYEVQPMAAEQLIRRFLGLPASRNSVPTRMEGKKKFYLENDPPRVSVEDPNVVIGTRVKQGTTKTGEDKWVDLVRQSRNLTPENKQRMEDVFSKRLVFHPENGWIPNPKASDQSGVNVQQAVPANDADEDERLAASEDLNKAPLRYDVYSPERAKEDGLPDIANSDRHQEVRKVKLPNGLEYRQYRPSLKAHQQMPRSRITHTLFDPATQSEVAYMETQNEEDPMAENGMHPNVVQWSEVDPHLRGKGLGRQLYHAALVHGVGQLTSGANVSPEAHKAWTSFKGLPGIGGRIARYPDAKADHFMSPGEAASYEAARHHVFVRDKSQLDMNKLFPKIEGKLAASEDMKKSIRSLDDIRAQLETPQSEEKINIPEHLVVQWSVPHHRWKD